MENKNWCPNCFELKTDFICCSICGINDIYCVDCIKNDVHKEIYNCIYFNDTDDYLYVSDNCLFCDYAKDKVDEFNKPIYDEKSLQKIDGMKSFLPIIQKTKYHSHISKLLVEINRLKSLTIGRVEKQEQYVCE